MTASGLETILAVFAIMETTRRTESSFSLLYHIPTPKSNPSLYNCHTFGKPMVCLGAGDLRTKREDSSLVPRFCVAKSNLCGILKSKQRFLQRSFQQLRTNPIRNHLT